MTLSSRSISVAALVGLCVALSTTGAAASGNASWAQIGPTTLSERQHAGLAFDPDTHQLVVFGGDNSVGVLDDTWIFDGSRWQRLRPTTSPPARTSGALAFDPKTGTIILFGGDTHTAPNGLLDDTWSFDGTNWQRIPTAHAPSGRYEAAMAYDAADQELVLFGGIDDNGFAGDTWTFDGQDWTEQNPSQAPGARYGSAFTYDAQSGDAVLFGGLGTPPAGTTSPYLADTWSWQGHQWTQLQPAVSPPGRFEAGFAPLAGGEPALFGGYADSGVPRGPSQMFQDTWTWNGNTWAQAAPATSPPPRYAIHMSWDPDLQAVVTYGGCCNPSGGFLTDTWSFDGSTWSEHERSDAPTVRQGSVVATDPQSGDVVVFGGFGGAGFLGDTWTERGGVWTAVRPTTAPVGRFAASFAWDTQHDVGVLFGGQAASADSCSTTPDQLNPNHLCNDTWTFDGSTWVQQLTGNAGPSYRSLAAMAYDPATKQTVLYGGFADQGTFGDTWTWDGLSWTQQQPNTSPPALDKAMLAFDDASHQLILFGGEGNGPGGPQYFNETWSWDGSTWTQLSPPASPPAQSAAAMTYDPQLGGLLLVSGCPLGDCTQVGGGGNWLWNGTTWVQLDDLIAPPTRYFAVLGYDSALHAAVLFGGAGDDGFLDDTWAYGAQAPAPVPESPLVPLLPGAAVIPLLLRARCMIRPRRWASGREVSPPLC